MSTVPSLLAQLRRPALFIAVRADRSNPMLVRRVRQELRSRVFIATYLVMLLVAGGAAVVAACLFEPDSSVGRTMFAVIASTWTALMCIQAFATQRAITNDRGAVSWDLIELTGIPPFRLVGGVVQANLVLGLLGAAGLAPFMVMAYLLRGIDLPTIGFALIALPMLGALLGAFAALGGCLGSSRQNQNGATIITAVAMVAAFGLTIALWSNSERGLSLWLGEILRGSGPALRSLAAVVDVWALALMLCFALATALLTHRALDRSTWPRLAWAVVWLNGLAWVGVALWTFIHEGGWAIAKAEFRLTQILGEMATVASTFGVVMALILGLFALTEDLELTPRQERTLHEGGWLMRGLRSVFGPGSVRGARATLVLLVGSLIPAVYWLPEMPSFYLASYGLAALVLGDILARHVFSRWCLNSVSRRICTIATLASLGLLPLFTLLISDPARNIGMQISPLAGSLLRYDKNSEAASETADVIVLVIGAVCLAWLIVRACIRIRGQARVLANEDDADPRR